MPYYKAVTSDLKSLCTSQNPNAALDDKYVVQYKEGEFVKPKVAGTKLFVFDSFERARDFTLEQSHTLSYVYECEITNPVHMYPYFVPIVYSYNFFKFMEAALRDADTPLPEVLPSMDDRDDYWRLLEAPAPVGTVFVDSVKLTKKVWHN